MKFYLLFFITLLASLPNFGNSRFTKKKIKSTKTTTVTAKTNSRITANTFALKSYTATIFIDEKNCGRGLFTIDSLNEPNGDENLGWTFIFEGEPSQELKDIFVPHQQSYYLPYKNICHDILYVNPFGSPKRFELTVLHEGKIHYVKINLPFAESDTFINDEEATEIRGLVNILRVQAQDRLNSYKKSSSVAASNYINNKPFLLAIRKGDAALKETIKVASNESQALTLIIKSDTNQYNELKAQYDKVEKEYTQLRNSLDSLNDKISEAKNLRMDKENSINEYRDKKADVLKAKIEEESKKIENNFENSIAKLSAEVPFQSTIVQAARKDVLELLHLGNFTKKLKTVYSGN